MAIGLKNGLCVFLLSLSRIGNCKAKDWQSEYVIGCNATWRSRLKLGLQPSRSSVWCEATEYKCDYAALFWASEFRKHLETQSGEKSRKCNPGVLALIWANESWKHLETHRESSNKCNKCDYALGGASDLRKHLKTHSALYWAADFWNI